MSKIVWDQTGSRLFETGTDQGVLFPVSSGNYGVGVAWNGLTGVSQNPSGGEPSPFYADNIKYLNLVSDEEFACTIEAYTYPDEFEQCDGSASIAAGVMVHQQPRKPFGLSYRTKVGNDVDGVDHGYKIHLVYGCMASPSEKGYATIGESVEPISFSWSVTTTPVAVAGQKPTAHISIDSTKANAGDLAKFESLLYGADEFSASSTYAVGDYVVYGSGSTAKTYRCKTAIATAAAWDASKWDEVGPAGPHLPLPAELATIFTTVG